MSIPTLFLDIDTQHDFMDPDGRLSVPDAASIVSNLEALTELAAASGIPVVASVDTHSPDDPEFEQFGPHCVAGSKGQQKIAATSLGGSEVASAAELDEQVARLAGDEMPQLLVEKHGLDIFGSPLFSRILRGLDPQRIFLYGVATEYCVVLAALGLVGRGHSVALVRDAVKAIDAQAGAEALQRMEAAGVDTVLTAEVTEMLAGPDDPQFGLAEQ